MAKKEKSRREYQIAENQEKTRNKIGRLTGNLDNENSGHGLQYKCDYYTMPVNRKANKKKATVSILISAEVGFRINTRETSKSGSIHQEEIRVPICMCCVAKPQVT